MAPYQSCGIEQPFTARITTAAGAIPPGVANDPVSYTTFGFFTYNRLPPPEVRFAWVGSGTAVSEPGRRSST